MASNRRMYGVYPLKKVLWIPTCISITPKSELLAFPAQLLITRSWQSAGHSPLGICCPIVTPASILLPGQKEDSRFEVVLTSVKGKKPAAQRESDAVDESLPYRTLPPPDRFAITLV